MDKVYEDLAVLKFSKALGFNDSTPGADLVKKIEHAETRRIIAVTSRTSFNQQVDFNNRNVSLKEIHAALKRSLPTLSECAALLVKNAVHEYGTGKQHCIVQCSDQEASSIKFNVLILYHQDVQPSMLFGIFGRDPTRTIFVDYFTIVTTDALLEWSFSK